TPAGAALRLRDCRAPADPVPLSAYLRRLADRVGADAGVQPGGIAAATLSARPPQSMDLVRDAARGLWPRRARGEPRGREAGGRDAGERDAVGRDAPGRRTGTGDLDGGAAGGRDLGWSGRLVVAAPRPPIPDASQRIARPASDRHGTIAGGC